MCYNDLTFTMEYSNDLVYFAKTNFRGQNKIFGIRATNEDRFQHMYVIGQTGTGKSTLLKNLAIQDIKAGRGMALVDPHGEFVEDLLEHIPPERQKDVIYFNPADTDYPIGFNVLEVKDPSQKHLVSSGLMAIFTKIWANVWSARMEYILNNSVLALLDTPGTTLLGITRMLVDKPYRKIIVDNIKDPVVKSFWVNEYEQYQDKFRTEAIAPIQNKVGQFLSTYLIRNIVGQAKSTMDIEDIMNNSKILLANVSKGRLGEDNSALIGAMLITKIQLTAMERVKIANIADRAPFILYVDEFQNFATDSFAAVLSEARKYRLGLVISHQFIGQLISDTSTKVRDAIFGNVGTMITFRVGAPDAEFLEKQYAPDLLMEDLVNLPNRTIYLKLMIDGISSRPFSAATLPPIHGGEHTAEIRDQVIALSRLQHTKKRADVEADISEWSGMYQTSSLQSLPRPAPSSGNYNRQNDRRNQNDRRDGPPPRRDNDHISARNVSYTKDDSDEDNPFGGASESVFREAEISGVSPTPIDQVENQDNSPTPNPHKPSPFKRERPPVQVDDLRNLIEEVAPDAIDKKETQ